MPIFNEEMYLYDKNQRIRTAIFFIFILSADSFPTPTT